MADVAAKNMTMEAPSQGGDAASSIPPQYAMSLSGATADPYDEDQAELQFLLSKPTCFIILGKPGSGKTTLARRLAQEWKCEMVNATDVISQAIEMQTEMGLKAQEILLRGEAIPEEVAAKMIEDKINSPEVAHHGYILDGFPSLNEDYMSVRDQLELVKNWTLKPDFIINLRYPDRDLEVRRVGQRIDPQTGELYIKDIYDPSKPPPTLDEGGEEEGEGEEEEEEEEQLPEEGQGIDLPNEVIERLIRRPEDLPAHVAEHVKRYKSNMLRILEDYIADHDQQHLIELDANKPIHIMFKELLTRLSCFVLRPAAVPIRLQDADDDEIPEDVDTDELMRSLGPKEMVAPRYRWRRSRWLRYCPVALAEGNLAQGKPEFAVSFLDKMYILSSPEAMAKFLKNPRPYLMPPQPRPPCKLVVTGPPLSGKTTLSHQLASKYGAKVLDMDEIIKPRMEEERKKIVDAAREEALENAIVVVKAKIKEEQDLEKAKAAPPTTDGEDTTRDTEAEEEEEKAEASEPVVEGGAPAEAPAEAPADAPTDAAADAPTEAEASAPEAEAADSAAAPSDTEPKEQEETAEEAAGSEKPAIDDATTTATTPTAITVATVEVDANHSEVQVMVATAVELAEKQAITLPPEAYIEVLDVAIKDTEKEMRARNPNGPLNGGWIIDNFPRTRDQWNAMIEKGLLPDDIVCLKDDSENGDFLVRRWYHQNKADVDAAIETRLLGEAEEKKRKEEEARLKAEAERKAAEEAAAKAAEEERLRRLEEGEEGGEPAEGASEEAQATGDEKSTINTPRAPTPDDEKMPPDGPEVEARRALRKAFDTEWPASQAVLGGSTSLEPVQIDICQKNESGKLTPRSDSDIMKEATAHLERHLAYRAWELQGMDIDEEEEDNEAEMQNEDQEGGEEEEEEEEDPNRSLKKQLGDTSYFCPVALKEKGVLWPGNPEIAAKYRERIYYLSTAEARERFLAKPTDYLPHGVPFTPPPLRLLLLGPKGAGKTLHGKQLASKRGLFHIQFRERLQELIIAKTKKKVGKEYEEEQQEDIPDDLGDELEEEEAGAITAPDGTPVPAEDSKLKVAEKPAATAAPGEEENKEEEELDLTEDEEAIKNYLENEDPLPNELLEKIISPWWNEEPFKSTGFILEGFPRTADETALMGELGLFPDAGVVLAVEDGDVIGRLMPPKLARWKARRAKLLERKAKIKERKAKKRDLAIAKKREELTKERDAKKAEKRANREAERDSDEEYNSEEEEEEEEEDDIETQLAEMFEEEEEEEEEELETLEDATDRMRNDLEEVYDNDTNRLAAVQDKLEELLIPRLELDGGRKPHIVRYQMGKRLRPYVQCRHSMFERVAPISEKLAMKMLQVGYKQPSRFGKWCPVQLSEGDCIQPMQGPGYPTFPAIYRQHIYFLSSAHAREQFQQDPRTYLNLPTPKPVVPIRMAIIGPPKSGKTALARRFADEYGLMRLSLGEAVRTITETQPNTELAKTIATHLRKGLTVTDELAVRALEVVLMDMRSQTRGYVLDGFPVTRKQVDLMTSRHLIPVRVLELQVDSKEIGVRAMKDRVSADRAYPVHDSAQILMIKLAAWHKEIGKVREWYQHEHANWEPVNGEQSKWWVWNRVTEIAKKSVVQIQTYLQHVAEDLDWNAASIGDMCITPEEFKARLGDFDQYCPVSLAELGELVDCSVTPSLQFAVEFRGHYYKTAGQGELNKFLQDPESFVPPLAPCKLPPPELLPKRRTAAEAKALFPMPVEIQGYCPVTYLDGRCRYEAIVPGDPELVVQYRDKLYYMADEEKLQKFLRLPEKYWNLKLPHKLPPKKNPLDIYSLPMLGYLEQSVADAVIKSLTAVGNIKPKYPFLSSTRSALVYVAFHLKAYNPRSSDYVRKKYRRKLNQFEDTCELIRYLGNNMSKRYKDPGDRPIDFDFKMEKFMALKGVQPTTSWVA